MAINFPDSPAIGDEFTGGGFTWTWNGSSWEKVVAASSNLEGFRLLVGTSGNTTFSFSSSQPAGIYTVTSALHDITYDIYLINSSNNQNVGYSNNNSIEASDEFDKIVVYGATNNDVITFDFSTVSTPETSGDINDGAAPFLTSASSGVLLALDDSVTVTGGNFASDVTATFIGQDGVPRPAKSVVRSSSTEMIVTRPDTMPADQQPYTLKAINPGITESSLGVDELINYFGVTKMMGGDLSTDGTYNYFTFTGSGTLNVFEDTTVEALLVAGGGGSSGATPYQMSGGAGAGGVLLTSATSLSAGSYVVEVGAGGTGGPIGNNPGTSGENSVISLSGTPVFSAIGGGKGGTGGQSDQGNGGSGGAPAYSSNGLAGLGTTGQGNDSGTTNASAGGAGGGGAGGVGGSAANFNSFPPGGAGAQHLAWANATSTGESGYYGGGGGGSTYNSGTASGGIGGGGDGKGAGEGLPGLSNTGGGAGGTGRAGGSGAGAAGGSGLVIVRYQI